ncbi:hypothetical protein GCM10022207_56730 [Streptomyces lannensis]|uniref:Uncharacterized protein n=1 Tax=Streptomyces lannensis TaxID=766498 RepID=A0ABP7KQ25_9ACTN
MADGGWRPDGRRALARPAGHRGARTAAVRAGAPVWGRYEWPPSRGRPVSRVRLPDRIGDRAGPGRETWTEWLPGT